jgi:8-oxo-dGTP diphosphatase
VSRDDQGLAQGRSRYQVIPRTLCFITNGEDVLLLRGSPHKRLWAGLYNGVGGHLEPQEDVLSAARREIREETGLDVPNLWLCGLVHVDVRDPNLGIMLFIFTGKAASRDVVPSAEGDLVWVPGMALPDRDLVEDLPVLLSRVLAMQPGDAPFFAVYTHDADNRQMITFAAPE